MGAFDAVTSTGRVAPAIGPDHAGLAPPRPSPEGRAAWARDSDFLFLLGAYRRHGGLARLRELLQRGLPWPTPEAMAPVVRFEWAEQTWLPLFQFEPQTVVVRADVRRVARELGRAFDDWQLALWFAEPNLWLGHRTPVSALAFDADAVCAAARADRFIAMG